MQLVMLETNGNQRFIFSSPRLRENIGASYLLTRLETWTEDALKKWITKAHNEEATDDLSTDNPHSGALDKQNPPRTDDHWVSRSSGKVIFTVDSPAGAREIISAVTMRCMAEAPGMDVSGVFIDIGTEPITAAHLQRLHEAAAAYALTRPPADARFSQLPFLARAKDSTLPASPPLRVADEANDDKEAAYSLPSRIKRHHAWKSRAKLVELAATKINGKADDQRGLLHNPTKLREELQRHFALHCSTKAVAADNGSSGSIAPAGEADLSEGGASPTVPHSSEMTSSPQGNLKMLEHYLESSAEGLPKVAIIHIDGNGVGAIMRNLDKAKERVPADVFQTILECTENIPENPHEAPDALRLFLLEVTKRLEKAVNDAFARAWSDVAFWAAKDVEQTNREHVVVPVVPVLLGGDDVTVISTSEYAIGFVTSYLRYYEENTLKDTLLRYLGGLSVDGECSDNSAKPSTGPMTAAAGIAIVRHKFPFHIAYDLAERVISSAKNVGKKQCLHASTFSFHLLFDSTVLDARETVSIYSDVVSRPYFIGENAPAKPRASATANNSSEHPTWDQMLCRVKRFNCVVTDDNSMATETFAANDDGRSSSAHEQESSHGQDSSSASTVRFPRTRAVRLRKLQMEAVAAAACGDISTAEEKRSQIDGEVNDATKELGVEIFESFGGINGIFDLIELSELLSPAYLAFPNGRDPEDCQPAATTTSARGK